MDTPGTGSFAGKVAFVTGAASGIGRATALAVCPSRRERGGRRCLGAGQSETARLIEQQGGRALAVRCDVTRAAEV